MIVWGGATIRKGYPMILLQIYGPPLGPECPAPTFFGVERLDRARDACLGWVHDIYTGDCSTVSALGAVVGGTIQLRTRGLESLASRLQVLGITTPPFGVAMQW